MKTVIISGSARKDNNTLRVAKAISNMIEDSYIIDFQAYDLPNANDGFLDQGGLTPFQKELTDGINEAGLLIVLTPEYNWFPSSEIVNMVHQLASDDFGHIFDNMVAAFVGVSTGRGGRMPAVQLSYVFDKIFNVFNHSSITSPKKFESQFTTKCIDKDGNLLDNQIYNKGLSDFVDYSINVAKRWHSNN